MSEKTGFNLSKLRMFLWVLVLVSAIGATVIYVTKPPVSPLSAFGGPFTLDATTGGDFSDADLAGTPSLMFFGYTFCPDVCPTTLAESTGWRTTLDLGADELRIIFVSVDPERDDLENLEAYLSAFGSQIIGLTGTLAQVEVAKSAFGVFSEKVEDDSVTDYLVNHTASVFLIDRSGNFAGTIGFGEAQDTALAKITRLVGQ